MRLAEPVRRRASGRGTPAEPTTGQHDGDVDGRAVQLRLVHVRYGALGVRGRGVQHVRDPAVRQKLPVDGHLEVLDVAVAAEDFAQVRFVHVLGELLDHDLRAARLSGWAPAARAAR